MPKFAANIGFMFQEFELPQRFEEAAKAGFKAVEMAFPYDYEPQMLKDKLDKNGLEWALFNCPPGDWESGERGTAALPSHTNEFRSSIELALGYAEVLECRRLHVMAGVRDKDADAELSRRTFVQNLRWAAKKAEPAGRTLLIEPINQVDMPGYFVSTQEHGAALIAEIGADNVQLQFDFYHCQMTQGKLAATFEKLFGSIGHVQIAGVPGRHEPDVGEINYPFLFDLMDRLGYSGFVGCEYAPLQSTADGLGWFGQFQG